MKMSVFGRLVFGGSAVLFGIICLMWHDADTWQIANPLLKIPFGVIVGECLMIAFIAAGVGMVVPRTARIASIVLAVTLALFALDYIPVMLKHPNVYVVYGNQFESFAILCGALAVYASIEANATVARVARLGLGVCSISFMVAQIVYPQMTAPFVPTWIPPNQMFWVIVTDIAFGLAAIALLINRQARLAARLMTVMLGLFGLLVWVPQLITHPESHGNWSEFTYTYLITGAAWMVSELRSLS